MRNKTKQQWMMIASVCCGCFAIAGCGGVYDASVQGIVTLDNNRVPRGTVSFSPVNDGPSAFGQIGADGTYTLNTGREAGLPLGVYRVSVVANEPPAVERTASGGPPPPGPPITPAWYRSPTSSGLEVTVDSGSNDINLELTSTPPAGWQDPTQRRR